MKTIISIGITLIAGWALIGQGTASAQSNIPKAGFPLYPNSAYIQPNNNPNRDAIPKYPTASWVLKYHKPY